MLRVETEERPAAEFAPICRLAVCGWWLTDAPDAPAPVPAAAVPFMICCSSLAKVCRGGSAMSPIVSGCAALGTPPAVRPAAASCLGCSCCGPAALTLPLASDVPSLGCCAWDMTGLLRLGRLLPGAAERADDDAASDVSSFAACTRKEAAQVTGGTGLGPGQHHFGSLWIDMGARLGRRPRHCGPVISDSSPQRQASDVDSSRLSLPPVSAQPQLPGRPRRVQDEASSPDGRTAGCNRRRGAQASSHDS